MREFRVTYLPHQLAVYQATAPNVVYVKGRRAGGTHGAVNRLLELAHSRPGSRHLWVDTVHRNIGRYVRRYFLPALRGWPYQWRQAENSLHFSTGAYCDFGSAQRPENIEGFGYDTLWVNEAGIVLADEGLYYNTLLPMLAEASSAQAFFIGAPKGPGLFEQMYQWGQDPTRKDWASFRHASHDNPFLARATLEALRQTMPERVYRQEILAEFLEGEDAVFRDVQSIATASEEGPLPGVRYAMGVDLARYEDHTVVWVARADNRQAIHCARWHRLPWAEQARRIAELARRFNHAQAWVDATGVGDPICEMLAGLGVYVSPVHLTHGTKQQLIDQLALGIEQGDVRIFPHGETLRELAAYRATPLPGGGFRTGGRGAHDDCVIALALCYWGLSHHGPGFILGKETLSSEQPG